MKEGRAGSTQASAAAHLRGAGNYNSWHASRRPPPSALLIGAESERVGWRGGSGRGLRRSYWRKLWLLSAFYIPGRPGGAWSADFLRELWGGARPWGRLRSCARLAVVPGRAAERRSCSPSCRWAVQRPGDAGGSREPASVLCEAIQAIRSGVRDGMWSLRDCFLSPAPTLGSVDWTGAMDWGRERRGAVMTSVAGKWPGCRGSCCGLPLSPVSSFPLPRCPVRGPPGSHPPPWAQVKRRRRGACSRALAPSPVRGAGSLESDAEDSVILN